MDIYESIVIMDSLIPPREIDEALERFSTIITENKGKVRKVEKWGKKRLAFEIQKKQYGFYISIEFDGEGTIPTLLQSEYNYNDSVLRYLTYGYDKNKLKVMKANAQKEEAAKSLESAPKPEPQPEAKPAVEEKPVVAAVEEEAPQAPIDSEETAEENKE